MSNPLDVQVGGEHYKSCKIQPVEFIEANSLGFLEGCVIKRLARHEKPTGKGRQDIEKAIHELQLLLQLRYSEPSFDEVMSFGGDPRTTFAGRQAAPVVTAHPDGSFIGRDEPTFVVNPAPLVVPPWPVNAMWQFMAQDADGEWYAYQFRPAVSGDLGALEWESGKQECACLTIGDPVPNPNWRNTLQERPKC